MKMVSKTGNSTPQVFVYKEKPYMKIIPSKKLFNSTMIHEVVTRGDFFALDLTNGIFTVLPKDSDTFHQYNLN